MSVLSPEERAEWRKRTPVFDGLTAKDILRFLDALDADSARIKLLESRLSILAMYNAVRECGMPEKEEACGNRKQKTADSTKKCQACWIAVAEAWRPDPIPKEQTP